MKRVTYAGSDFLTGDEIATALLECSEALAEAGEADTVSVPTREADGSVGLVMVLIGPASQIVARHELVPGEELVDQDAVARLRAIERRHRPVAAVVDAEPRDQIDWDSEVRGPGGYMNESAPVVTRSNRGQWENHVPGHPELSESFTSKEEAVDAGRDVADRLGLHHVVEDAAATGAITDEQE